MKKIKLALMGLALALAGLVSNPASAAFVCGGLTFNSAILVSAFASFDVCQTGDKIFDYNGASVNLLGASTASIDFQNLNPSYQVTLNLGTAGTDASGNLNYFISVNNALCVGCFIEAVGLDSAVNALSPGIELVTKQVFDSLGGTLLGTITDTNGTVNSGAIFALTDPTLYIVDSWSAAAGDTSITSITNSFLQDQAIREVPEPASLALLGAALVGLGWARRRFN